MWALDLKYVDRNSWMNYNSMYSVAVAEHENATKFLMTETSMTHLTRRRIAKNMALGTHHDELDGDSEIEYLI